MLLCLGFGQGDVGGGIGGEEVGRCECVAGGWVQLGFAHSCQQYTLVKYVCHMILALFATWCLFTKENNCGSLCLHWLFFILFLYASKIGKSKYFLMHSQIDFCLKFQRAILGQVLILVGMLFFMPKVFLLHFCKHLSKLDSVRAALKEFIYGWVDDKHAL